LPAAKFLSLGGAYSFTENWRVNARYGHNQQPNNSSMLGYGGVLLSGEKANKWELGLQGTVNKVFNPEINYFYREVQNEKSIYGYSSSTATCVVGSGVTVVTNGASSTNYTPCFTQADTTRSGFELVASGMFAERSNYRLSWTHFTELSDSIKETTPSDMAELTIKHGFGRYTLTGAVKYVSKYKGSSNGTVSSVPYSGYTRYDLGLGYGWRWNGNPVQTTIYGKNLANTKYETALGIQDVGRVVGVELLASF
jgi:outer membrane cobalamin receptor